MVNLTGLELTPEEVILVDSDSFDAIPRAERARAGARVAGEPLGTYWRTDLGAGHEMKTWAVLNGTKLTIQTTTQSHTLFGGFHGAVSVTLSDAAGVIGVVPAMYTYGVEGKFFQPGRSHSGGDFRRPGTLCRYRDNYNHRS